MFKLILPDLKVLDGEINPLKAHVRIEVPQKSNHYVVVPYLYSPQQSTFLMTTLSFMVNTAAKLSHIEL